MAKAHAAPAARVARPEPFVDDPTAMHEAGLVQCKLHPTVLFSIVDHFSRRQEEQGRVLGTLLGTVSDGVVDVLNSFPVPHSETDQATIDSEFQSTMCALHRKVHPKQVVVGWYSTGSEMVHNDQVCARTPRARERERARARVGRSASDGPAARAVRAPRVCPPAWPRPPRAAARDCRRAGDAARCSPLRPPTRRAQRAARCAARLPPRVQFYHQFFEEQAAEGLSPLFLLVDTSLASTGVKTKAFVRSEISLRGTHVASAFKDVRLRVAKSEAERVGIDHIVRSSTHGPDGLQELVPLRAEVDTVHWRMCKLLKAIEHMQTYIEQVEAGTVAPNAQIGRALADTLAAIPKPDAAEFAQMVDANMQVRARSPPRPSAHRAPAPPDARA